MTRNQRIKIALKEASVTQTQLAERLGVSHASVNERLNAKDTEIDSFEFLLAVSELTGKSPYWLYNGEEQKASQYLVDEVNKAKDTLILEEAEVLLGNLSDKEKAYLKGSVVRPVTVTVDRSGKELISYVPVKAQAGYANGFGDPKFMQKLPAFTLPNFNDHGTFRMFQVSGDSMLQLGGGGLKDGDVVIGQYVEDFFTMRDNMVYVVVYSEGVVIKRIINRLSTADKALIMKSDNRNGQYPNFLVHAKDILEVWEYKAHISRQLNFATDLWELINDLQAQQAILANRVDNLDSLNKALTKQNSK